MPGWLCEVHGALGNRDEVQQNLRLLVEQGFVALDPVATDASHLFCQTIVQNAVYDSVPHNVRTQMHQQVGRFIEASRSATLDQYLDLLAYHYDRSDNMDKKAEYLWKAGVAAQNNYANEAAIDYFQRLLPMVDGAKAVEIRLRLGNLFELVGRWDDAAAQFTTALQNAEQLGDLVDIARCYRAMGQLLYHEQPDVALDRLNRGLELAKGHDLDASYGGEALGHDLPDEVDISEAAFLVDIGWARVQMGDLDLAMDALLAGLAGLPDAPSAIRGNALSSLSGIFRRNMNAEQALAYAELAVENSRAIPDLAQEQMALTNLAAVYYYLLHDWGRAVAQLEEVTEIAHRIGDRRAQAALEVNLGSTYLKLGNIKSADLHLQNGIALCRQSRLYEYEYEARTALVELYVRCSDLDGAGVQLDETRTLVETMDSADKYAKIERLTAERSLAAGRQQEALVQASSAVQIAI